MGIYGDLMKLNQDKKARKPERERVEPEKDQVDRSVSSVQPPQREKREKVRKQESSQSSKQAIMLSGYHDSMIELIRRAVKFVGKDPFFGRFTPEEKRMLADVAYTYKRSGVKTSENEIARIAVNFIVADYKENGENCLLERVLKALNG